MKEVTAAIIIKENKILIAQRAPGQKLEGKWEFPGGKIEPGESAEECLIREIQEEFNSLIAINRFFAESIYHFESGSIKLLGYVAELVGEEISLSVHSEIRWIGKDDLDQFDYAPADVLFIEKLKEEWL